jgi:hypothetical protein
VPPNQTDAGTPTAAQSKHREKSEGDAARMKLSPQKVEFLAEELLDYLMEVEGVLFQGNDTELRNAIAEIITDELMVEERLDAEIHKMLQAYKYEITTERLSYDDLFRKTKRRLISERRLVL